MQALVVALALIVQQLAFFDTSQNARIQQWHKGDDCAMPFNPSGFTELDQSLPVYLWSNLLNTLPKQGHAFGRSTKNTATSPTLPCAFRICGSLHAVDNVKFTGVAASQKVVQATACRARQPTFNLLLSGFHAKKRSLNVYSRALSGAEPGRQSNFETF